MICDNSVMVLTQPLSTVRMYPIISVVQPMTPVVNPSSHAVDASPQRGRVRPAPTEWKKPFAAISLVLLGVGLAVSGDRLLLSRGSQSEPVVSRPLAQSVPQSQPRQTVMVPATSNFVTAAVDQVGPAVVRIDSAHAVTNALPEAFDDPVLRQFLGSQVPPAREIQRGVGSGFILSKEGEILTNAHVVEGANTVKVTLKDGRTFTGKVIGSDRVTDVAVIKIEASDLPTVPLGNSDVLKPGEWAIAIGNPLGLDNTVTTGIVSATGRSSDNVGVPNERVSFIQTDAAINPGNSGGPLLNAQGQVIGMNTAIIKNAQGIGFAIPINTAKRIADQLIATGKVNHPYLGVEMLALSPELKQQINSDNGRNFSVDRDQGVLVVRVVPDGPAAQSGLRSGDVIDQINDQPVTDAGTVQRLVEQSQVGEVLNLRIYRQGQLHHVKVQTGSLPAAGQ